MKTKNDSIKVLISGGGTGGHIFPAISIANALKKINPNIQILFVGAEGKMEMDKVPAAGYDIVGIPVIGFPRKPTLKVFVFIIKLLKAMRKARKVVKQFKPDIAVGVGGFASGPALKMAARLKVPYVIQEQNSYPGITNKMLGKKAQKIFVAYENMENFFMPEKIMITGNPIRQDIKNITVSLEDAFEYFNLDKNKFTILVTGGSLGALTINQSVYDKLNLILEKDIQLIWQTGSSFIDKAKAKVQELNSKNIFVSDFIFKMDYAYKAAGVIISRAGASTISELCVVGKPAILVPSPNVAEDHQTKNVKALVEKNAALFVKDIHAREKLIERAIQLSESNELQQSLIKNIQTMCKIDAADTIANEILKIVNDK
jgi:UDP-N-acetylglucosamine--N-acetylmuramyl-(pentapeptide) pyrophosphoryl-undecaprenol N-acetylglucosamine transferase